jgi:hypothetical protein
MRFQKLIRFVYTFAYTVASIVEDGEDVPCLMRSRLGSSSVARIIKGQGSASADKEAE